MAGYWDGEEGEKRIAALREMSTLGMSCAEIASALSAKFGTISRNAVIGKLARLKITHIGPQTVRSREPRPARRVAPKLVKARVFCTEVDHSVTNEATVRPLLIASIEPPAMIDDIVSEGVNYLDNPPWGCKALIGKRGTDKLEMCCGQPRTEVVVNKVVRESAYCARHHRLFHTPREERRRAYG